MAPHLPRPGVGEAGLRTTGRRGNMGPVSSASAPGEVHLCMLSIVLSALFRAQP